MINMIEVFIDDETGEFPEELKKTIIDVANKAAEEEGFTNNSEVDVLIVDNSGIQEINKEHRDIDSPTDVLSFPMDDFEDGGVLGDLVISSERAEEQRIEYGHSIKREIGFLTAHGMLHLFGYDHMTPEEEKEMFEKQDIILKGLNLHR
ncbi:MAG: rRNA maturation RNase YbeY [Eubacteriales bacterium]|nr:rRNA maturation RNase YbeY [Eubacteriales bacterium]